MKHYILCITFDPVKWPERRNKTNPLGGKQIDVYQWIITIRNSLNVFGVHRSVWPNITNVISSTATVYSAVFTNIK